VSILALQAAFDFSMPQVSFTAHISGAIVGLLLTLLFGYRRQPHVEAQPAAASN
jgi:membrane associated rhomboid family serine protease